MHAMHCVSRRLPFAGALLYLLGCGASTDQYASDHAPEIRYDCTQALACQQSSGGTVGGSDLDKCIKASGNMLVNDSDAQRATFEQTVKRCGAMQACGYIACAALDTHYSQAHQLDIQYECQQSIACRLAKGEVLAQSATADCLQQTSNTLDMAMQPARTAFETHLARCHMLTGCAYVSCQ